MKKECGKLAGQGRLDKKSALQGCLARGFVSGTSGLLETLAAFLCGDAAQCSTRT